MLPCTALRRLTLAGAPGAHLSAASGLVRSGGLLHVVADDELSLGIFPAAGAGPGVLLPLFAGGLPAAHAARKAAKPDLEMLCLLPASVVPPHGALLALGSGSRPRRSRGALLALGPGGGVVGPAIPVEGAPLWASLRAALPELNLEGAAVSGDSLVLLQRGNGPSGQNAVIELSLSGLATALEARRPLPATLLRGIRPVELGDLSGVPWGFTDAAPLPGGRLLFSAAAEASASVYDDGACMGCAIGVLAGAGVPRLLARLDAPAKVEGLDATALPGGGFSLLLVTDADDPASPAFLLGATLPGSLDEPE